MMLLALLCFSALASAATPDEEARELGFTTYAQVDRDGRSHVVAIDQETRHVIDTVFRMGQFESREIRDAAGALLFREESSQSGRKMEYLTPPRRLVQITALRDGITEEVRLSIRQPDGSWKTQVSRQLAAQADVAHIACYLPDRTFEPVKDLIDRGGLGKIAMRNYCIDPKTKQPDPAYSDAPECKDQGAYLGWNFEAVHCGGSANAVGAAVQTALKRGLSCLKGLGPERHDQASQIAAWMLTPDRDEHGAPKGGDNSSRPLKIFCGEKLEPGAAAEAVACPNANPPQMKLSSTAFAPGQVKELPSTIFHEMLHWLGYKHDGTTEDLPYLAEMCCFPETQTGTDEEGRKLQKSACDLIRNTPGFGQPNALQASLIAQHRVALRKAGLQGADATYKRCLMVTNVSKPASCMQSAWANPCDGRTLWSSVRNYTELKDSDSDSSKAWLASHGVGAYAAFDFGVADKLNPCPADDSTRLQMNRDAMGITNNLFGGDSDKGKAFSGLGRIVGSAATHMSPENLSATIQSYVDHMNAGGASRCATLNGAEKALIAVKIDENMALLRGAMNLDPPPSASDDEKTQALNRTKVLLGLKAVSASCSQ